jgi:hypothetical protein
MKKTYRFNVLSIRAWIVFVSIIAGVLTIGVRNDDMNSIGLNRTEESHSSLIAGTDMMWLVAASGSAKGKRISKVQKIPRIHVDIDEVESRGFYPIMKNYIDDMCIKELPFFIAMHRCFYDDRRLRRGSMFVVRRHTLQGLRRRAADVHGMESLAQSDIVRLDSLCLYKRPGKRSNRFLCDLIVYCEKGGYEIPETGAKIVVPRVLMGSIYYNKKHSSRMVVYLHTGGIKLELPGYAKKLSLGVIGDMDIGFAELEYMYNTWNARLLYVSSKGDEQRKGWTFNVTECKKIRPYSE